jgi:methylated-DNA-[protein]-cysteine S-methyltransferase
MFQPMEEVTIKSPIGYLQIFADEKGISRISFKKKSSENNKTSNKHLLACMKQLKEYFEGRRKNFSIKMNPEGTDFQKRVWKALESISFGKTASYSDIASAIKNPKAVRAVGMANRNNPIPLIAPCHRIIGKSGKLVGYNGGLDKKEWLLQHEQA